MLRGRPFGLVGTPVAGEVGEFPCRTKVGQKEKESSLLDRSYFCLSDKRKGWRCSPPPPSNVEKVEIWSCLVSLCPFAQQAPLTFVGSPNVPQAT